METHNWITIFLASMRLGDTPVPIPNTTVKTQEAGWYCTGDGVGEQVDARSTGM